MLEFFCVWVESTPISLILPEWTPNLTSVQRDRRNNTVKDFTPSSNREVYFVDDDSAENLPHYCLLVVIWVSFISGI